MTPDLHPGVWLLAIDWSIRIAALWWIPAHARAGAARSWLLLVGFVPLFGLPLYLLFGHPWVSRRRRARHAKAVARIREVQRTLQDLRGHPPKSGELVAALVERTGGFMPLDGNRVALSDSYTQALADLVADIDGATREVHLLYYLMFDDAVGREVARALRAAAARGVRCRLLLDAVGAKPALRALAPSLRAAGVEVHGMYPGGLAWRRGARMDLRNHRKIAVIDGVIGHTGSQNLAAPEFVPGAPNRELVARVEGPVVAQLAAVFASDWYLETGEVLDVAMPGPLDMVSTSTAQVLPSGPEYPFPNGRLALMGMLQQARASAVLATPYFVPDDATLAALRLAALSGVEVTLLLSGPNNQRLAAWAQGAYFDDLMAAGVRIALYRPGFLHAKHLRVDDGLALVGSMNLDIRSFSLNAELGLLIHDPRAIARLRAIEQDCLAASTWIDPDTWASRPRWQRARDGVARLADAVL